MFKRHELGLLCFLLAVIAAAVALAEGGKPQLGMPPGAPSFSPELRARLAVALEAQGRGYVPRTGHRLQDGSPEYTNRLILESSPYLLQHAHNPVNWYAWGPEALADAARLGRPVLLSIGYSTCHWCHVMEEESFEDEEIAAFLNENYIAIKVDREERPDLDSIYMSAVQALTGRGGWPMTSWLTPDGRPFYGGTYFPARDGDRGTRKGFLTLLRELKQAYDAQPESIAEQAERVVQRLRRSMVPPASRTMPDLSSLQGAMSRYTSQFDALDGGRRQRPKFPSSLSIRLLLAQHRRTGSARLLEMATLTLSKMAGGGMYDQLGGGFHRYSTDSKWLVPHFEKMLYDNALLAVSYLEGYQATGNEEFSRVTRDILTYVGREMTAPQGGFYSATDADSLGPHGEREEGWFFTWTPAEIEAVVGADDARLFNAYYGVTAGGNFEGRSILNVPRPKQEVAKLLGLPIERLEAALARARPKLYQTRSKRPAPLRDDKILTSWNGLMISAMARGGFVLDEPEFVARAGRAADFVLSRSRKDDRLLRSFKGDRARHNAYLDDYAFLIAGLLDLYETTFDPRWLREALSLQDVLDEHYRDSVKGGYFMTSDDHELLLAREKPASDGAEPSGNSIALMNLLRFHELTLDDRYRSAAQRSLECFGELIRQAPTSLSEMLLALDFWLDAPKEIVLVTGPGSRGDAAPFLEVLRRTYVPNRVLSVVSEGRDVEAQAGLIPLVKGKLARKGLATAYVCEKGVCQLPTTDVAVFARQLERRETPATPDE